jgi:tetratricopeptide (TPR) repeat protein
MGILFILLSLSYKNRLEYFKRYFPPILILVFISLGWLSYSRMSNFKNSLTLMEYDAATSPNDPRLYSDITRMNVPEKLNHEISAIKESSQLRGIKRTEVSKEELWKIIDDLKKELKLSPNDQELHHALAVAYFARGLFLSSEENFFAVTRSNPQDASIQYNLGILYYGAHIQTKAEKAWQEALRLNPIMGNAHLNLSVLYYESGQYQSALDHCQKAIQLGIPVPSSLVNEIQKNLSK